MIKFRDQLFTFSNSKGSERYDPIFNDWSALKSHVDSSNVAVVKGEIYAVQVNTIYESTTITKYNVELCKWEIVNLSFDKDCRVNTCVVAAGRHLYMIGGWKTHTHVSQNVIDSTPWKRNGKKSLACRKKELALLGWPLERKSSSLEGYPEQKV